MCKGGGGVWGRGGRSLVNIEYHIISMVTRAFKFHLNQWIFQKLNILQNLYGLPTETIISTFNFAMHQETIQINSYRYFCRGYQKLCNTRQHIQKMGFK